MNQQPYQHSDRDVTTTKEAQLYTILVVDDEPNFSAILSEILRSFGYFVQQVNSVAAALETLGLERPDLILTDIMMPGIDGLTFVRMLRDDPIWSEIPTVVISAKALAKDIDNCIAAGADACLVKPFSAPELRKIVKSFLPNP